jgi:hypothetical protein
MKVDLVIALGAASHALRSYQFGNASTELAKACADHIDKVLEKELLSRPQFATEPRETLKEKFTRQIVGAPRVFRYAELSSATLRDLLAECGFVPEDAYFLGVSMRTNDEIARGELRLR